MIPLCLVDFPLENLYDLDDLGYLQVTSETSKNDHWP